MLFKYVNIQNKFKKWKKVKKSKTERAKHKKEEKKTRNDTKNKRDKKTPSIKKKREVISVTDGAFELKFCDFYFSYIGDIFWKKW